MIIRCRTGVFDTIVPVQRQLTPTCSHSDSRDFRQAVELMREFMHSYDSGQ
jgi:hypothetical protein